MVQTKRAEINSDTAVSIAHHHRPGARPQGSSTPSYDPDNEGAWDGQLANPDLVDQLPPPIERKPGGPMDRDEWRRSNAARVGHAAYKLLDGLSGYSNPDGRCWPGMDSLTKVTGMSERVIYRGFLELRVKAIAWLTYPGKPVCKSNPYQLAGGLDGWATVKSDTDRLTKMTPERLSKVTPRTLSSSNPKINPRDPVLVDAKRVDHVDHPGPETGVTTGVKISSFEEEGVTGDQVTGDQLTVEEVQAWVDGHLSETPLPFEIQQVGKHCWPAWSKHWDLDLAGAIVVWIKTEASRRKFRKDVVMHLPKVGLPKPKQADPEQEAARERDRLVMDQRLSEGPKRRFKVKCAGCGLPRQLKPGETHCYQCRNLSEDPQLASQPDRGPGFADDYEKLIEENIRRYHQEAHGPAPEDAKVEAVGAALDAG